MDAEQVKALVHTYAECPRESIDWGVEQRRAAFAAIDAMQAEIDRLKRICETTHDRLLRGDSDKELLAMLQEGWQGKPVALSEEAKGTT